MFQPRTPLPPPRLGNNGPSLMGRALLLVAGLLLLLVGIMIWPAVHAFNDAVVTAVHDWRALVGAGVLLFIGMVLTSIVLMLFSYARKVAYRADQAAVLKLANNMPAHVGDLRNGQLIASLLAKSLDDHYAAKLAEAERPTPNLHSLNYHNHMVGAPPAPALPGPESAKFAEIPTFAQLLDSGAIGPNRPLILGYSDGQAITGDWNKLYSCGVGGMTGSGKSWVIAFLAGQSAAAGARIILIDPHAGDPESLSNRLAGLSPSFMCDVASSGAQIESALKLASSKLENRRSGRGGTWPLLLICDEWTSMLRGKLGDLLTATALDYAEQGRKYGCFGILAAQAWQVDAAGEVRDRLASHYVMRARADQFRYQTGLRSGAAPEDTLTLQPGHAYMLNTRGELQKVIIPTMTQADILRLGTLVDQPGRSPAKFGFTLPTAPLTPLVASGQATGRQLEGKTELPSTAAQMAKVVSPDAARAASLFLGGKSPQEIATEMRGVNSNTGGRKYQAALSEIFELIRQGVQS